MKKRSILCLILAAVMLLSVLIVPLQALAAAEAPQLTDAGFEGSIWTDGVWSYWLPDGGSWDNLQVENFYYSSDSWMTPATNGGDQALKFYFKAGGAFYFTQELTDAPAGTYTITAQSMGAAGETVYVKLGDQLGDTVQTDSGYNNWTVSSGTFTITEDCATLIVGVYVTGTADGWGYIDNLTLTYTAPEEETPDEPAELAELTLDNGDFEAGSSANWTLSGYSKVATNQWASNNTSYTLDLWLSDDADAPGSAAYTVGLTAGTYYFTFDLSGAGSDSGLSYTISSGETVLAQGAETYTTSGWDVWETKATEQFTLTEDADVTFTLSGTSPAKYWGNLDNLKLYGTGALTEKVPDPVEADIYVPRISGTGGDFMRGMDVSSLLSVLNSGATFKDWDGNELDGQGFMNLVHEAGTNWIRLRVWNDPYDASGNGYGGGNCDVNAAVTMGKWATNAGMQVLIDFHYSDFWADPGKQQVPKDWSGYTVDEKADAIYAYTYESLKTLLDAGVNVGMVQIGNETTNSICGESDWASKAKLFSAGSMAVRDISDAYGTGILVAIHFTNPERSGNYANFAKQLDNYGVDYDVFASSYYPYWHGTLENLTSVLKTVADTYGKYVIVAETSWAYTLEDGDGWANTVRKNNNDSATYEFSVQGQATEIASVTQAVRNVGDKGIGVFYWESAWIPVQVYDGTEETLNENKALWEKYGSGWASSYAAEYDPNDAGVWYGGSAVDNQALFDFEGNPLASLNTYKYMQSGTTGFDIVVTCVESPALTYTVGDALALPEKLTVSFNVGADESRAVTWNEADVAAVDMNTPGTYTIQGTVEGDLEATCTVTVKSENLLLNPSMEGSDMSMYTSSQSYAKRTTNDPYTGSYSLHFYNSGIVDFTTEQTVTLAPGHYEFSLYGQGGDNGEDADTYIYVKVDDVLGETVYYENFTFTGWANWVNPTIEFHVAQETQVTVGVCVTATQNGGWGTFDDWYLCEDLTPFHFGGSDATCTEQAVCGICGEKYGELDATNHTGGTEIRDAKEATEDAEGYTGDTYCLACGEKIASGTVIPKKDPVTEPTTEPTTAPTTEPTTEPTTAPTTEATTATEGTTTTETTEATSGDNASTGDSGLLLLLALMMLSLAGITLLLNQRKAV